MHNVSVPFTSFLGARVASTELSSVTGESSTSFFFASPTSVAFTVEVNNPPMPVPRAGDLVMAEYTIQNEDGSFKVEVFTFASTILLEQYETPLAVDPAASNINGTPISSGLFFLLVGESQITFSTFGEITLDSQPTLPPFSIPGGIGPVTITFRLFVNNGLYFVKTYPAKAEVVWRIAPDQSITGVLEFQSTGGFSGAIQLLNTSFSLSSGPLTGTITATLPITQPTDPGFDIKMDFTALVVMGQTITGTLNPALSHLNDTFTQLISYVTGSLTSSPPATMVTLLFESGQVLGFSVIPMLSENFTGTITLTQGSSTICL